MGPINRKQQQANNKKKKKKIKTPPPKKRPKIQKTQLKKTQTEKYEIILKTVKKHYILSSRASVYDCIVYKIIHAFSTHLKTAKMDN